MEKVICIVQARMGSTRLPGKVMNKILDKPMISYVIERLKKCETVDEVVLATSVLERDTPLAEYIFTTDIECFRGSEDNVLERYVMANREYKGDVVIRVTGDCPLIDPVLVDLAVNEFLSMGKDYVSIDVDKSAVFGLNVEVFSALALEKTYDIVSKLEDFKNYKEHVTIYMYRHPEEFTLGSVIVPGNLSRPYRFCVDEINDFRLIEAVYNHFKNPYPTTADVVDFLDKHPEIASLNKEVRQKKA